MLLRLIKWATLAVACGSLGACQSDVESKIALAGLSSSCHINSDCSTDLACVFQRCHAQCNTSRDCGRGSRCVAGEGSRNVCQLADEVSCGVNGSCRGDQVCGVDGECRDACGSDAACISEQVCRAGTCADTDELDAQGDLAPSPERPENALVPCAFNSDCPGSQICQSGACVTECSADTDCAAGSSCRAGRCEAPPVTNSGCLRNSDCKTGERCLSGACQPQPEQPEPECDYDSDCEADGQHCVSGACQCECAADADCSLGQVCQGGCQCVAGRVIQGNVLVVNQRQLAAITDVVEITGQLMLSIPGPGEYHLPNLRKAGQFSAVEHRAKIVADVLEEVKQAFTCTEECEAPRLKKAGSVTLNSPMMASFELPELEESGDFNVWYGTTLTRVAAPQLKKAGHLRMEGNVGLVDLVFPQLTDVTSILFSMNERVRTISMPLAKPSLSISIVSLAALETLSLPSASVLSGDTLISGNQKLKTIDLSGFKQGNLLSFYSLPALTELRLPNLTELTNAFTISACGAPGVLDLPLWKSGAGFVLSSTKFTTVNAPQLEKLGDLNLNTTALTALDLPVSTLTGMIYLYGNDQLQSVSLPNATSATSLNVLLHPNLTSLSVPQLANVGDIYISGTGLTNLDTLGALKTAGYLGVRNNPALPVCAFNHLVAALQAELWDNGKDQSGNLECTCSDGGMGATCL